MPLHERDNKDEVHLTVRHPFITGLINALPPPKTNWSMRDRVQWLEAAEQCFKLIYTDNGDDDEH